MATQQYTCPMHPAVNHSGPGKCPGCGMDLIPKHPEREGHDMQAMSHMDHESAMASPATAKQMEADMRRRFWISLLLSIPIFLYSPVGANIFKIHLPSPIPVNWLLLILTTPIVFWTGSIFYYRHLLFLEGEKAEYGGSDCHWRACRLCLQRAFNDPGVPGNIL